MTESKFIMGERSLAEPAEASYRFENGAEFRLPRSMVEALRRIDKVGVLQGWAADEDEAVSMFVRLVGLISFAKAAGY
jgi:hypothetical protein